MSVQSAVYVLAIILALLLLVIVLAFGAIVGVAYPNRRPSFSYFACGMTPQVTDF
jgi:ATP dependent DNA ligase C terminal region